jgi:hypothetical protein
MVANGSRPCENSNAQGGSFRISVSFRRFIVIKEEIGGANPGGKSALNNGWRRERVRQPLIQRLSRLSLLSLYRRPKTWISGTTFAKSSGGKSEKAEKTPT